MHDAYLVQRTGMVLCGSFLRLLPHAYPLFAGETPLDMSSYRCLSMDWRNSEKLASYVLVQSKVLVMTDSLCFIPLPPHTHTHTIWYECLSPHSPHFPPPPTPTPHTHTHPPTPHLPPPHTPFSFFLLFATFHYVGVILSVCLSCLLSAGLVSVLSSLSVLFCLSVCLVSCLHAFSLPCFLCPFCFVCPSVLSLVCMSCLSAACSPPANHCASLSCLLSAWTKVSDILKMYWTGPVTGISSECPKPLFCIWHDVQTPFSESDKAGNIYKQTTHVDPCILFFFSILSFLTGVFLCAGDRSG